MSAEMGHRYIVEKALRALDIAGVKASESFGQIQRASGYFMNVVFDNPSLLSYDDNKNADLAINIAKSYRA